jgi:hypothetical protein
VADGTSLIRRYTINITDKYIEATNHANELTQRKYGDFSIPFENDTDVHYFWLEKFDEYMIELMK